MAYFENNDSVVDAFLNQKPLNAGRLKTDGQSLFSYDLRIAEHIPDDEEALRIFEDASDGLI